MYWVRSVFVEYEVLYLTIRSASSFHWLHNHRVMSKSRVSPFICVADSSLTRSTARSLARSLSTAVSEATTSAQRRTSSTGATMWRLSLVNEGNQPLGSAYDDHGTVATMTSMTTDNWKRHRHTCTRRWTDKEPRLRRQAAGDVGGQSVVISGPICIYVYIYIYICNCRVPFFRCQSRWCRNRRYLQAWRYERDVCKIRRPARPTDTPIQIISLSQSRCAGDWKSCQ